MPMDSDREQQLHFVLFPLMAQGHMIPMVDVAKLLARRRVKVTIVTTPHNASRFQPVLARAVQQSGLQIHLLPIPYPSQQLGFPKDCENLDSLPSLAHSYKFCSASSLLLHPVQNLLQHLSPNPTCIISDLMLPYTAKIANKFHIPRICFLGASCFFHVIIDNLKLLNPLDMSRGESPYFLMPGLPDPVQLTAAHLPKLPPPEVKHYQDEIGASMIDVYGLIVNSFEELEPKYAKELKKTKNRVWCVGPVSLCNDSDIDKAQRGNKASIDEQDCLKWLDSWEPNSVIYACMGSICNLIPSQLVELGLGLESSRTPFIWVLRNGSETEELEKWIKEDGFEERVGGRGILIRGWAPQLLILSHPSVGGFLSHCGWNSTLEGVCAGVPMVTWPLFSDQLINEKMIVEILKVGVRVGVGVEVAVNWGEEEETGVVVRKEDVKKAIEKVMDGGEEAKQRRSRVKEVAEMAKRAVGEGGSSYLNITELIEDIKGRAQVCCSQSQS